MWSALRELFASVPSEHRLWLALAVGALLVVTLGLLTMLGLDLAPFWALLSSGRSGEDGRDRCLLAAGTYSKQCPPR